MIQKITNLGAAASVAAGSDTKSLSDAEFSVLLVTQGTFVATLQLQVSVDGGTTWVQAGANVTTATITAITCGGGLARINTSAFTSGTPAAYLVTREGQQIF